MTKAKGLLSLIALVAALALPKGARAYGQNLIPDFKVERMNLTLQEYSSPLVGMESVLIQTAEEYDLDWTLLAAIAGNESAFALRMPYECNNPFGWGIYGENRLCFESLEDSIREVGQGIAEKYNTDSLYTIARTYNPGNTEHWMGVTALYMQKIKNQAVPASKLPIVL